MSKTVLVTGASSGMGRATAALLAQQGYRVFGTSRRPDSVDPIPGVEFVALDVNDDDSVQACVQTVIERAGAIDVLINNAGYQHGGAIEETSLEEARAQFETNFFGVARLTKAVLPIMRAAGRGQIINIGSVVGWLVPVPFMGFYAASKQALEGYSEVLRYEVRPFNINVSLVEAGFIRTNLAANRQMAAAKVDAYAPWMERSLGVMERNEREAPPPELVAATILRIVKSRRPAPRYAVGPEAKRLAVLRRFAPWPFYERGIRGFFNLDKA